jgi:putative ABC transport system permease protein
MTIKGKKTATFKDKDWDAYRNNSIGFVFQSYNLISHLSIVANVELGMTLSGVSGKEKRERAIEVLQQVGLKDHLHKNPNQLSGGQMQRVAIARALANNPEILLCDEPTGALDTKTSKQIMNLIRDLSKDRLVIMVTHNPEIAEEYADRTIRFEDGLVESDSNPHTERPKEDGFSLKKTAMSFMTALHLSGNNILTKKGRTFLTAFASSIGIIGIAVILSLSNGFQLQIDKFQEDALAEFPIVIMREITEFDHDGFHEAQNARRNRDDTVKPTEVTIFDPSRFFDTHLNVFCDDYLEYIKGIDPEIAAYIGFQRMLNVNALRRDNGEVSNMVFPTIVTMLMGGGAEIGGDMMSMMGGGIGLSSFPIPLGYGERECYMERNFELLAGEFPSAATDLLMIVGRSGRLEVGVLNALGFDTDRCEHSCEICADEDSEEECGYDCKCVHTISFDEILSAEFMLIGNNDFYVEIPAAALLGMGGDNGAAPPSDLPDLPGGDLPEGHPPIPGGDEMSDATLFIPNPDLDAVWNADDSIPLRIVGIVRENAETGFNLMLPGIVYSDELLHLVIDRAQESDIVAAQRERETSVFPDMGGQGVTFTPDLLLSMLGADAAIGAITIYPTSFENKDALLEYLDAWNEGKPLENQIHYTDIAGAIMGFMSDIISAITIVLIAFASISLVVSLIMIAIITYVSVLERTKEIGILRALGARKKDITRVFDAETFIIGACSGLIGIIIAWLITIPANIIIESMTNLPNVAQLNIWHAIGLLILSTALTVLGGHLPAKMASKRDAVEALRSE